MKRCTENAIYWCPNQPTEQGNKLMKLRSGSFLPWTQFDPIATIVINHFVASTKCFCFQGGLPSASCWEWLAAWVGNICATKKKQRRDIGKRNQKSYCILTALLTRNDKKCDPTWIHRVFSKSKHHSKIELLPWSCLVLSFSLYSKSLIPSVTPPWLDGPWAKTNSPSFADHEHPCIGRPQLFHALLPVKFLPVQTLKDLSRCQSIRKSSCWWVSSP